MKKSLLLRLVVVVACGTHLSAVDTQRAENMTDEFASLEKDVPDSGVARIKTQSGYCTGRSLLRSAGVTVSDAGAFQCPK